MDLPGPIHDILVVFLGPILILAGLVVLFTNPIYSAFSLGLVLVCISLFYILTNSYFVAVAQLLIYVGAINVLVIFVVMFMNGLEYSNDSHLWIVGDGVTSLVCTSMLFSLITTIRDTSWNIIIWSTRSNQIIKQDLISNVQQIGIHLSIGPNIYNYIIFILYYYINFLNSHVLCDWNNPGSWKRNQSLLTLSHEQI